MYASLQAHRREELGRRDDLWSWFYLVLDFIRGELPWAYDAQKKNREIVVELKEYFTEKHADVLVEGLPGSRTLLKIMGYLSTLSYSDKPDYAFLRKKIKAVEDKEDEQELLEEWEAMSNNAERARHWKKLAENATATCDTLLKVT